MGGWVGGMEWIYHCLALELDRGRIEAHDQLASFYLPHPPTPPTYSPARQCLEVDNANAAGADDTHADLLAHGHQAGGVLLVLGLLGSGED